eukprot:g3223.t1
MAATATKKKYARTIKKASPVGKDHPLAKMHIRVGIEGKPETIKRIPRLKLTLSNVKSIFGVHPAYLKDDTGNAIFPKFWQTKCLGPPVLYTIKEKQKKYVEVDAHEDLNYDGSSTLCLLDVPLNVDEILLEKLIRFALEDEDPVYRNAVESITETEKRMKELEEKIRNIPFLQIREAANATEEQAERLMMSNFLEAEQKRVIAQLDEETVRMTELKRQRDAEKYEFRQVHVDEGTKLATWQVIFEDEDVGVARGAVLLQKGDWTEIRVFRLSAKDARVVKGDDVPEDVDASAEVNVRGVKVVRRRNGRGLLNVPGETKWIDTTWNNGVASGRGSILTKFYQYEGNIQDGAMSGRGALWTRDGRRYDGSFASISKHRDERGNVLRPLLRENEYHNGTYHTVDETENSVMKFADGSVYEGHFKDGKINGRGVYRRVDGVILRGMFKNGLLHGEGSLVDPGGRTYTGTWRNGKLNGYGEMIEKDGDDNVQSVRKGRWADDCLDGYGEMWQRNHSFFRGMWRFDRFHGLGTLMYDEANAIRGRKALASQGRGNPLESGNKDCEKDYRSVYDGFWHFGKIGTFSVEEVTSRNRTRRFNVIIYSLLLSSLIAASDVRKLEEEDPYFEPEVKWFEATLDHFSYTPSTPQTFKQKFLVYDKFWTSPKGPLLVYFGNEGSIEDFWNATGFVFEVAEAAKGLVVFLEHRFYGDSLPFGVRSYTNENLRFLTIEQALADMADFLSAKEKIFGCREGGCPTVLFGGSYGGMLAAWFMLKYPFLANGAIAASAPVDIYPGENKSTAFMDAGLDVFGKYGSSQCEEALRDGLDEMQSLSKFPSGRARLATQLRTCEPITNALDADRANFYVRGALSTLAMLDYPFAADFVTPMPANPVSVACEMIDEKSGILPLKIATDVFLNWTGQLLCHNITKEMLDRPSSLSTVRSPLASVRKHHQSQLGDITRPWNYQACTELIDEPLTSDGEGFFVEPDALVSSVESACRARFQVEPRPKWMLKAFGDGAQLVRNIKNVIFSDGEKDPWKVGGVPLNASDISPDGSVLRLLIEDAAHHQDLRFDNPLNPPSVAAAKATEREHIFRWIGI